MRPLLVALAALALQLDSFPYSSPEYGFAMTVPPGFAREGEDPLKQNDIACFVTVNQTPWVRLCVEAAGGGVPDNARQIKFAWNGAQLDGVRFVSQWDRMPGVPVEIVAVHVPLQVKPVWLLAMTPASNTGAAQATVVSTLASFKGATGDAGAEAGKLTHSQRMERLGEGIGRLGSILIAIGAGMWLMKRRKKNAG